MARGKNLVGLRVKAAVSVVFGGVANKGARTRSRLKFMGGVRAKPRVTKTSKRAEFEVIR